MANFVELDKDLKLLRDYITYESNSNYLPKLVEEHLNKINDRLQGDSTKRIRNHD